MKPRSRVYIAAVSRGSCMVCGNWKDLRMGSCFECSEFVSGVTLLAGVHKLWDRRNPSNVWYVRP